MKRWALAVLLVGCIDSRSHMCGDKVCPSATTCDEATSTCIPPGCGDGVVNNNEECDGADLGATIDCTSVGFYDHSPVTCAVDCQYNTDACSEKCGDTVVNGPELCDGDTVEGRSCLDYGYGSGRLSCADSCTPTFDSCTTIGLTLEHTATFNLHGIDGRASNDAYAVGGMGKILHYDGSSWSPVALTSTAAYQAVWIDPSGPTVVAVGNDGASHAAIARFDGQVWKEEVRTGNLPLVGIWGRNANDLWAVGGIVGGIVPDSGYAMHFFAGAWEDPIIATGPLLGIAGDPSTGHAVAVGAKQTTGVFDGATWVWATNACTTCVPGTQNYSFQAVYALAPPANSTLPEYIAVGTSPSTVPAVAASSLDGGVTWTSLRQPLTNTTLTTMSGVRGDLYIGGTGGVLLRYDGRAFHQIDTGTLRSLGGVWRASDDDVRITFIEGQIWRLGTAAWSDTGRIDYVDGSGNEINPPGIDDVRLQGVATFAGETLLAGNSSTLLSSMDGRTWKDVSNGQLAAVIPRNVTGVWFAPNGDAYASVAGMGDLMFRPHGVNTVFTKTSPLAMAPVSTNIFGVSATDIYVVAHGAKVSHGPTPWTTTIVGTDTTLDLNGVWASGPNDIYVVGDKGLLAHSTDGATWTLVAIPNLTTSLAAVWGTGPNDVFVVGGKGTILHFDGAKWRYQHKGNEDFNGVYGIAVADPAHPGSNLRATDVFAFGPDSLSHYDGTSWSPMSQPALYSMQAATALGSDRNDVIFVGARGFTSTLTRALGATETRCTDGWDDDRNGLVDCADPACARDNACQVVGGACRFTDSLTCNTSATGTTFTGISRVDTLPMVDQTTDGPEATYRFDATASAMVTLTLTPDPDHPVTSPSLVVLANYPNTNACNLDAPIAARTGTGELTFAAAAGTTYSIVVDEAEGDAGAFDLSATCN
ncbi:MAG TPA: hypothetical protein VGM90_29860 [Kofleriaceae bacterium]|jgi:hypothetical protein